MIKDFINYSIGFGIGALIWMGVAYVGAKVYVAIKKEMNKL